MFNMSGHSIKVRGRRPSDDAFDVPGRAVVVVEGEDLAWVPLLAYDGLGTVVYKADPLDGGVADLMDVGARAFTSAIALDQALASS